jgi:lactoylglutathione lyase
VAVKKMGATKKPSKASAAKKVVKQKAAAKPRAKVARTPARAQRAKRPAKKAPEKAKARKVASAKLAARAFVDRHRPESLRLRSAGPSFTVSDIENSLAFYRDVLGFVVRERWEQAGLLLGVELVAGAVSFWLGQDDWKKGRDRVKGQGFRLYCTTNQDVAALAARVRSTGMSLYEELKDQPWGGRDFAVEDPDGFVVTIASTT